MLPKILEDNSIPVVGLLYLLFQVLDLVIAQCKARFMTLSALNARPQEL